MSGNEFLEYVAYNQIEPFGDEREDMRAAIAPWVFAGCFSKKGKSPKFDNYVLSSMLREPGEKPTQEYRQMETTLKNLVIDVEAQK